MANIVLIPIKNVLLQEHYKTNRSMVRYKISAFIVIILWSFFLFMACDPSQREKTSKENNMAFDTIEVKKQYFLDDNPQNPSCNISLFFVFPSDSDKASQKEIQRIFVKGVFGMTYDSLSPSMSASEYVRNYMDNYKLDAKIYREHTSHVGKTNDGVIHHENEHDEEEVLPKIFYSYYETLSDSIIYNRDNILSFQVKQSNNKGGAMSYNSYRNYVINLKTATLITENDIFNPGYDMALRNIFINSLLNQNDVKTVAELEDLGYFGIEEIIPNKNFFVDDKGITYTFNKGEYSAYQLSAPVVFIPYSDIRSLLRTNTLVSKIAGL